MGEGWGGIGRTALGAADRRKRRGRLPAPSCGQAATDSVTKAGGACVPADTVSTS